MSLKRIIPSEELDDVLFELATADHLDPDEVRATIARHPEFASEILEFASEWIEADALAGPRSGEVRSSASAFEVELAEFWSAEAEEEGDPFSGVEPSRLQSIARESEVHVTILMQLCRRMIDSATVPFILVESVARGLGKPAKLLSDFLQGPQLLAPADYKSPNGRPRFGEKMSFAEAVRKSPMDESLKARWLAPGDE